MEASPGRERAYLVTLCQCPRDWAVQRVLRCGPDGARTAWVAVVALWWTGGFGRGHGRVLGC